MRNHMTIIRVDNSYNIFGAGVLGKLNINLETEQFSYHFMQGNDK